MSQEQTPPPAMQHQSSQPTQGHPHPDQRRGADRPFWLFLAAVVTAVATLGAALITAKYAGKNDQSNGSTPATTESHAAADPSPAETSGNWRQVKVNSKIAIDKWDFDYIETRKTGADDFRHDEGFILRTLGSAKFAAPVGDPSTNQCHTALDDVPVAQVEAKAGAYYCLLTDEGRIFKFFVKERLENGTAVMAIWVLSS